MNLFEPIVEKRKLHPNFQSILEINDKFSFDVLMEWSKGFVDRDGKFVKEFQTSFNSCFWELYLYAVLKKYGYKVDFSKASPDFYIPGKEFCIEATIASNPHKGTPEHDRKNELPPRDLNEFNRRSIIRLSNSIVSKYKKYVDSYSSIEHVKDKPFVIAVTSFDQPYGFLTCQRAVEALLHEYYVDEEQWLAEKDYNTALFGQYIGKVTKDNEAEVELGLFNIKKYSKLSAIIFSSCATWGKVRALSSGPGEGIVFTSLRLNVNSVKPHIKKLKKSEYSESLLDGLRIYHNPNAEFPLSPDILRHKDVFQSYYSKIQEDWIYDQRDGQLLFRAVESVRKSG